MNISRALLSGAATLCSPRGRRGRLLILIYHRVLQEHDPLRPDEIDAQTFEWQMELVGNCFNVLPLSEAVRRLTAGALPRCAASITFDDGYSDNLEVAAPILKRLDLRATLFVATAFLNGGRMWNDTVIESVRRAKGPDLDLRNLGLDSWRIDTTAGRLGAVNGLIGQIKHMRFDERLETVRALEKRVDAVLPDDLMLTTAQLKAIVGEGIEIGAHTVSHPILSRLDDARARREIVDSKEMLEGLIGEPVNFFAYPNGSPGVDYYDRHMSMVKRAGYSAGFSTQWGAARSGSDIYQLPRFTPWHRSPFGFHQALLRNYFR